MLQSHLIAKIKAFILPRTNLICHGVKMILKLPSEKTSLLYSLVIDGSGTRSSLIHFACIGVAPLHLSRRRVAQTLST